MEKPSGHSAIRIQHAHSANVAPADVDSMRDSSIHSACSCSTVCMRDVRVCLCTRYARGREINIVCWGNCVRELLWMVHAVYVGPQPALAARTVSPVSGDVWCWARQWFEPLIGATATHARYMCPFAAIVNALRLHASKTQSTRSATNGDSRSIDSDQSGLACGESNSSQLNRMRLKKSRILFIGRCCKHVMMSIRQQRNNKTMSALGGIIIFKNAIKSTRVIFANRRIGTEAGRDKGEKMNYNSNARVLWMEIFDFHRRLWRSERASEPFVRVRLRWKLLQLSHSNIYDYCIEIFVPVGRSTLSRIFCHKW